MSTLKVGAIRGVSASSDAITVANDGTATANITSIGGAQVGRRNLAINGADMMVAQRGTSTTGLQNNGGIFTIDRFAHRRGGTWANAVWKDEQVDSGTGLFKKALKKTTTTAEGSAAASGKFVMIGHYLEVQDTVSAFGDGTAEAKSFTVSFYVKASIATTYCLHVSTSHLNTNKAYMKQFTVNSAGTWERKTCTIPAITNSIGTRSGQADNATGVRVHWVLDAPTRASSQAADTWFTFTDSDFGYPSGQGPTGYANTLNATFELGGVQIEAGTVATDLEHRTFGDEIRACQRYFNKTYNYSDAPGTASFQGAIQGRNYDTTSSRSDHGLTCYFPVRMRANPTVTFYAGDGQEGKYSTGAAAFGSNLTVENTVGTSMTIGETGVTGISFSGATPAANMFAFHLIANTEM